MGHSGANDKHMENLVRAAPNIELSRVQTLRYPRRIDARAKNIQKALKKKPTETDLLAHAVDPKDGQAMKHGENGGQAHPDKHGCTEWPPTGRSELRDDRDADTAETDGANHGPVAVLKFRDAVEPVKDAGHEAPHNETHDPDIVESIANASHGG